MALPRIDKADGVVDGINRTFRVPNPYVPGTLVAMLNGRQLDPLLENGWVETDPANGEFEFNEAPSPPQTSPDDPGDLVSAYYENASEPAGGGSGGGVPDVGSARDVRPKICSTDDLAPELSAEGEPELVPDLGATEVRPCLRGAGDLRPRIERAEEL